MNCPQCGALVEQAKVGGRCATCHAEIPNVPSDTVVYLVTPGDVLDERWHIISRLGHGAMGSVFLGESLDRRHRVAIKILSPEHCRKPKAVARFEREARMLMKLRHPNIVRFYDVGRRGALPYLVMEYLEGETLAEAIKRKGGKLSPVETLSVLRQIASGLSFIHHHGLVHRDVKPQNVFISPDGRATILDLGVVRDKSDPGLTKPGAMVGTPYYMSPEQISGHSIDRRTDVYALGAMVFELLTGSPPFRGANNFEVLRAHRNHPVPNAAERSSFVPQAVGQVIMRSMGKHPDERQQNIQDFLTDFEAAYGLDSERTNPNVALPPLPPDEVLDGDEATDASGADPSASTPSEPSLLDSSEVELIQSQSGRSIGAVETDVRDRPRSPPPPPPTKSARGELRVVTTIGGLTSWATLRLDGELKGNTPLSLQVSAGVHSVRVERTGFSPVEREIDVSTQGVTLLRLPLEPLR